MAYLGNFDASTVEPADFSALPAGDYTAIVSASEFKTTKNGDGQYLALTFQIVDGPNRGRYLWHNLNLKNKNHKAEEIAQRELSAICRAAGKMQIADSEQLHDAPMKISVAYLPAKGDWPEKNQIRKWEPLAAAVPPKAPAAASVPPKAPAAASVPSWKRPAASVPPKAPAAASVPPKAPAAASVPSWKRPAHHLVDSSTRAEAVADDIPF